MGIQWQSGFPFLSRNALVRNANPAREEHAVALDTPLYASD